MRQVAHIMGMPITVDIPGCKDAAVFEAVFELFTQVDNRFSTYKTDSEVSLFAAGKIKTGNLSQDLEEVIGRCRLAEKETGGYFSAWASKGFDPSGYVKGWAIKKAGKMIKKAGYKTYCISAGGDILAASAGEKIWQIGIQDPFNKDKIAEVLEIKSGAVATSGNYERGAHITDPKTGKAAKHWASVTISGPSIIKADVLATACFAMGQKAVKFMADYKNYQFKGIKSSRESNR